MLTLHNPGLGDRRIRNQAIRLLQGADDLLIYAVRTGDGRIKIGGSADLVERLSHIHGGTAEVLALKPGKWADELALHRALADHAAEGREYYHPTPEVMAAVNGIRESIGLPTYR